MGDKIDLKKKPDYDEVKNDIQPIFEGFISVLDEKIREEKVKLFPKGINVISFTFEVSGFINIGFTIEGVKAENAYQ